MSQDRPALSLVIPLYNEAESLQELHAVLTTVLGSYPDRYEVIYVDDGSTDGSFDRLEALRDADPRVTVVRLRCNQGKTVALVAGFREARGEVIVTLDADLQDDPTEIPRLLSRLDEGYDLVSGWKVDRQDPWSRRILSRLFNAVTSRMTGVDLHDLNCGFKAYRRAVVAELRLQGDLHRFIPVLAGWRGFRIAEVEVRHHPRRYGRSKYGAGRITRGFFDLLTVLLLTRYTTRPLHLFGMIGALLAAVGLGVLGYLAIGWLFGQWIGGRPLLLLAVLMVVGGMQLVSLGLLAEMIVYGSNPESPPPIDLILK
jgi:glycosyltransferase involved in cell wall biosynthesis